MVLKKQSKEISRLLLIAAVLLMIITGGLTLFVSAEQEETAAVDLTAAGDSMEIEYFLGGEPYEEGFLLIRMLEQKGTNQDTLLFPETAGVLLSDGTYDDIPVSWESEEYLPDQNGQYRFEMKLSSDYQYDGILPYAVVVIGPDPYGC